MKTPEELLGIQLTDYQQEFVSWMKERDEAARACLYYKTGAGKSITAMLGVLALGYKEVVVIAPPITHAAWASLGKKLGVSVTTMSHAKFRMKDTLLKSTVPVIADEFHLFGGHTGVGFVKFNRLAKALKAPLVLCSATPNYNDIERCFCVMAILDPTSVKGGFLNFIYTHCNTQTNPFGRTPLVESFRRYEGAPEFLVDQPGVFYVEDDSEYDIIEHWLPRAAPMELEEYSLDRRNKMIVSSIIGKKWATTYHNYLSDHGGLRMCLKRKLNDLMIPDEKVVVFCMSSDIAEAAHKFFGEESLLITGKTSPKNKDELFQKFLDPAGPPILIGTASLATGADGMDKVCNKMIILHDTEDDAQRRQLLGRILPRGIDVQDVQPKEFHRIQFHSL